MADVKSGRMDDVTKINNIVGLDGAKGTSLPDVRDQEVKKVGVPPVQEDLRKSPVEKEEDDYDRDRLSQSDFSRAVTRDANARAMKLVNLEGLPE
ncbi:MAG: hypothetical protein LBJ81_01740 [Puniceicoccales bacterium]|nr:hypothetical protein [Puniceicoccales bacterium]